MKLAVLNSKPAQKDFENIKAAHSGLLTGMANQGVKVNAYNANRQVMLQQENTMKAELQKEKMVADTQAKKDALMFQQKQAEIDVKKSALLKS